MSSLRDRDDERRDLFSRGAQVEMTRRALFARLSTGIGGMALANLLVGDGFGGDGRATTVSNNPLSAREGDFPGRARRVIYLHMVGAPSQLDLFDAKPVLREHDRQPVPEELLEGQQFAFLRGELKLYASEFSFRRCGKSGLELSELLPHLGDVADEIAVVKTVQTDEFNHAPAQLVAQTGFGRFGRPSIGAWVNYGLGTENSDLPGFVVLVTGATAGGGNSLWGSGFLPSVYQGTRFRNSGDPVLFLSDPPGVDREARRRMIERVSELNRMQFADVGDPEIATRIAQYELAYRMQTAVPGLMDISEEPDSVHEAYGTTPGEASFANHCLLARRLVERGVRFVQLYDDGWDHHGAVAKNLRKKCEETDKPIAALIRDLKARGMLDDTLVVWASEFGRTPMLQGDRKGGPGRDHHKEAYCVWMAGGGVRGGTTYGETDDLGYYPAKDAVHVRDLHATILHLLGLDHLKLTYKHQGRQFRLTDIGGEVIRPILA